MHTHICFWLVLHHDPEAITGPHALDLPALGYNQFPTARSGKVHSRLQAPELGTTEMEELCLFTLLDLCVSSLLRGHAHILCIVPIVTDDPRREYYHHYYH